MLTRVISNTAVVYMEGTDETISLNRLSVATRKNETHNIHMHAEQDDIGSDNKMDNEDEINDGLVHNIRCIPTKNHDNDE